MLFKRLSLTAGIIALIFCSAMVFSACSTQEKFDDEKASEDSADVSEGSDAVGKVFEDYSDQINGDETCYELDGRVSDFPIVIGQHEHPECDDTSAELMSLGQEKFNSAVKLYKILTGHAPRDMTKEYIGEYDYEDYNALDEDFGTYDSIMELCNNTFAPDVGEWRSYYSVDRPKELLDSGLVSLEVDGEYISPTPITDLLSRAMLVEDGITYLTVPGYIEGHTLQTKIMGVLGQTDSCIEYRLCTMILDESAEALAVSEEIPQVFFEHSVMKLELIDGEWLITQLRSTLGDEEDMSSFIERYDLEF